MEQLFKLLAACPGILAATVAVLLTGCPKPRQAIELTFECPQATPEQLDLQLATPLELALNGMPYMREMWSVSRPGRVTVYFIYEVHPGTDHSREIDERLADAGELSMPYTGPTIREIAQLPILVDGRPMRMLEVRMDEEALKRHRLKPAQLWTAIATQISHAEQFDKDKLRDIKLTFDGREIPLADLAKLKQVTQPEQIVRTQGFRLADYVARFGRRPP